MYNIIFPKGCRELPRNPFSRACECRSLLRCNTQFLLVHYKEKVRQVNFSTFFGQRNDLRTWKHPQNSTDSECSTQEDGRQCIETEEERDTQKEFGSYSSFIFFAHSRAACSLWLPKTLAAQLSVSQAGRLQCWHIKVGCRSPRI